MKYELHHVHPGAGKGDLQALVNSLQLVLRQTRPSQWLVAADAPPPKHSILTEHGCILVQPSKLPADKGSVEGKGKGAKGKGPAWLLITHPEAKHRESSPGLPAPQPTAWPDQASSAGARAESGGALPNHEGGKCGKSCHHETGHS